MGFFLFPLSSQCASNRYLQSSSNFDLEPSSSQFNSKFSVSLVIGSLINVPQASSLQEFREFFQQILVKARVVYYELQLKRFHILPAVFWRLPHLVTANHRLMHSQWWIWSKICLLSSKNCQLPSKFCQLPICSLKWLSLCHICKQSNVIFILMCCGLVWNIKIKRIAHLFWTFTISPSLLYVWCPFE